MPKVRKVKRKKTYKANINRKRLRNKLRKLPDIGCKDIKAAWENKKSTRYNLCEMGLAYDPNEVLKIPNTKRELLAEARLERQADSSESENEEASRVPAKAHVASTLEAEAKAPRERMFRLPNQQVHFITYLMDKYGEDYEAMARDKKNYYQMTWRQIKSKISTFKGVPEQYAEYLLKKGDIVLDDPTPLEETRKRIAEENVKKFCTPKPKKEKPKKKSWLEEEIEDADFDTGDKLENVAEQGGEEPDKESQKKLKLFSDDEEDEENSKEKSKRKKAKTQVAVKNGTEGKLSAQKEVETNKVQILDSKNSKRAKALEILPSSGSESEEELEGDEEEAGFVDLDEMSEEELSEDDILDNGEFLTDSEESD